MEFESELKEIDRLIKEGNLNEALKKTEEISKQVEKKAPYEYEGGDLIKPRSPRNNSGKSGINETTVFLNGENYTRKEKGGELNGRKKE